MRIGFASLYSWRPHVEHTWYLAQLAQRAGHEVRFLTCDADLPTCYTRELRDRSRLRECLQCQAGGIRSYAARHVSSIGKLAGAPSDDDAVADAWADSSASTLGRFESPDDYRSPEFAELADRLRPAVRKAYRAACNWIRREKLDAVCVFNGRIDITRAVFEAARAMGVPVVTHERTWFGDGIQLFPGEHCLGLSPVWRMVDEWKDRPLTRVQARRAASLVARRFLRQNHTEWRAYNQSAVDAEWPVRGGRRKYLILPSSTNEIWGHPDWMSGWASPLQALDAVIGRLGLAPQELVLRCHPNWAEKIGKQDGRRPEQYFSQWARERGIHCIASHDSISTMHLIEQCDAIIVSVGSAALEAGVLGKAVISIGPSIYHGAGFTFNAHDAGQLGNLDALLPGTGEPLDARRIARQALRFAYAMVWRLPQYVDYVRVVSTTRYEYVQGADPQRLVALCQGGPLRADDVDFDTAGCAGEDEVLDQAARRAWAELMPGPVAADGRARETRIVRRGPYQLVDWIRNRSGVGDR